MYAYELCQGGMEYGGCCCWRGPSALEGLASVEAHIEPIAKGPFPGEGLSVGIMGGKTMKGTYFSCQTRPAAAGEEVEASTETFDGCAAVGVSDTSYDFR